MSSVVELSLVIQREALRRQLQVQRQVIAHQITQQIDNSAAIRKRQPRSMTMRFLTQQPTAAVIAELATLLVGGRLLKSVTSGIAISRMLQSVINRQHS